MATKTNKNGTLWDGKYTYTYNRDNTLKNMNYNGSYMFNDDYLIFNTNCAYEKNQLTKVTETTTFDSSTTTRTQTYTYDNHGRLKTAKVENGSVVESNKQYTYDNSGRLLSVAFRTSNVVKQYGYDDRGRLTSCYFANSADNSYAYSYDNYGNRLQKRTYGNTTVLHNYTWERGRLLKKIADGNNATIGQYTYDINGVRYTKKVGSVTTTYFYDGNTLFGENRSDGTRLRYFYDATGICGFSYYNGSDTKYYTYVKDVLGNIVMIKDDMGLPLVKYTYNEWGVCSMTAFNLDNQGAAALELGNLNPFRYRGYYYDTESKLYYLMSRYYDPTVSQFLSPDTPDYLDPETIGGVDLYAYCRNNPVRYSSHKIQAGSSVSSVSPTVSAGSSSSSGIDPSVLLYMMENFSGYSSFRTHTTSKLFDIDGISVSYTRTIPITNSSSIFYNFADLNLMDQTDISAGFGINLWDWYVIELFKTNKNGFGIFIQTPSNNTSSLVIGPEGVSLGYGFNDIRGNNHALNLDMDRSIIFNAGMVVLATALAVVIVTTPVDEVILFIGGALALLGG